MEKIKYLIILGPPGSGKGTQARMLAKKYRFFYFGTGDLMRAEAAKGTPLGQKFQASFEKGELVAEDLVEEFVKEKLRQIPPEQGIVFDGYPRTIKQVEDLSSILILKKPELLVLNLEIEADLLIGRLSSRRVCPKCGKIIFEAEGRGIKNCEACGEELILRDDDQPAVIQKRIEVYQRQTQPLIDYFAKSGVLLNIDGRPKIAVVTREIEEKLKTDEN